MSKDAFDRAVRALRETGETSSADVARTRMRVMETLHRGERRGRRTFWVLLPIAAVLAGSTALAKNSEVMRRVWTSVAETVGIDAPAEKSASPVRPPKGFTPRATSEPLAAPENPPSNDVPSAAPPEGLAAPVVAPPPEVVAPTEVAPDRSPPASSRPRRSDGAQRREPPDKANPLPANPPSETAAPEAPVPSANEAEAASLGLYKTAYRLHFTEQRYAAALLAWDEYLRTAPNGRLVVEARYNRGIALVRLGRRAEAEAVLTPFARGEVSGGYRAREARELLDALNASSR